MRIWIVLLLAASIGADEGRVTLSFKAEKVENVAHVLETYGGAKIVVDPEYEGTSVTMALSNVTYPEAIAGVAKALDGEAWEETKGHWRIAPGWNIALRKKLVKTKLDGVDGLSGPFGGSLNALRAMSGINVVADLQLDLKTKIKPPTGAETLQDALDMLCPQAGCAWSVRWGVVFVATKARLAKLPARPPIPAGGKRVVDLQFDETPLPDIVNYLAAAFGRTLRIDEDVPDEVEITVSAKRLDLGHALAIALYPYGRTAEARDGVITVK